MTPFGWTAENPVADSLTVRMEYAFLGEVPVDSLARLVDEFETAVSRMTADDGENSISGVALCSGKRVLNTGSDASARQEN